MALDVCKSKWAKLTKASCGEKCFVCGSTEKLQAHHIKPKRLHPDLENDLENGVELCKNCHLKAHGGTFNPIGSGAIFCQEECADVQNYIEWLLPLVYSEEFCAQVRKAAKASGETLASYVRNAIEARMYSQSFTLDGADHSGVDHWNETEKG